MARRKLIKFAEIKKMTNVFDVNEGLKMKGKWGKEYFGNKNPIVLEIGCGRGIYVTTLAEKFPNKNYIGIDKKGDRIWYGAKKAEAEKRKNVAFLKILVERLEEYFKTGEVDEIWLTFPDPYPKPSRSQRRLPSKRFLEIYKKVLKKGGIVHLKTDDLRLFTFGIESVKEMRGKILEEKKDIHKNEDDNGKLDELLKIKTVYEARFMALNKPIYYLKFSL